MNITQLGENYFMFEFKDSRTCDRIFSKQSWNFRGTVVLLERIQEDECPSDFKMTTSPFWVQAHGLQIRAINKKVGEDIGSILGEVTEVHSDSGGAVVGRCIHIQAKVDTTKPLVRWTCANIPNTPC